MPIATPYVGRSDAAVLIIEERAPEILSMAVDSSLALSTLNRRSIGKSVLRWRVLETQPTAKWLNGTGDDKDLAKKPTSEMKWKDATATVEEIAVIVVIPENVLDDADIDLMAEVETRAAAAIARGLDLAVFLGKTEDGSDLPASFPSGGLVGQAIANGNSVESTGTDPGLAMVGGFSGAMAQVEADGFEPTRGWMPRSARAVLRDAKDTTGRPLLMDGFTQAASTTQLYGVPITNTPYWWTADDAAALVGEASAAWVLVRQDITAKILDQATVGDINLAEQDAIAIRLKARFGFCVPVPVVPGVNNPYPFSVVTGSNTAVATVASISPTSGPIAGGTTITATGTNLGNSTAATVGGTAATNYKVLSNSRVSFVAPAHAAGAVNIVITDDDGNVTKTNIYTYV